MSKDIVFVHPGPVRCTPHRMNKGVEIYREGSLKLALSEYLKQLALQSVVSESDILPIPQARSTIEELYFLRRHVLEPNDLGGGYLVSCEKHGLRIKEIASVELKRYDWEFVPAENHDCDITLGGREFLARQLDRGILMLCRIYDRPDKYQIGKEYLKWGYNHTIGLFLPK